MNIIVRKYDKKDIEWLFHTDKDFPEPWPLGAWENLSQNNHCFIAQCLGQKIGYTLLQLIEGDDQAHLLKIYILPTYRGKNFGKDLLEQSLQELKTQKVYLEVAKSNTSALRFYEKLGFKIIHCIRGFYSNGEDAQILQLN